MPPIYRIHPAIGIARIGNSPDEFYISPEAPAALPIACDRAGNARLSPDGTTEETVRTFKDGEGRVKRQAARFQVYVYDEETPEGRPLKLGDEVAGGGNQGTLVDVQWRVWLANKKAGWYEFDQLQGEHGYAPGHPRRNPQVTGDAARQRLIIDPGPRTVSLSSRTATFDRDGGDQYATTFPPPLQPHSIDTLGELKEDDQGRLLVLGAHGNAGSYLYDGFGQPRIEHYANNDGWFDDTADGPVMARLAFSDPQVGRTRYVDVEYPAWVVSAYPGYVPQILDMVTMDELVQDLGVRQFATRTDLYGTSGTFGDPQRIDPGDAGALDFWRAGRLQWNPEHRPWFYRDIWPILFRPDEFSYLSDILGLSNFPHNQSTRGTFDPEKLGVPPEVGWKAVHAAERRCIRRLRSGDLFLDTLTPALDVLERGAAGELRGLRARSPSRKGSSSPAADPLTGDAREAIRKAVSAYVKSLRVVPPDDGARPDPRTAPDALAGAGTDAQPGIPAPGTDGRSAEGAAFSSGRSPRTMDDYLRALRQSGGRPEAVAARAELERRVDEALASLPGAGEVDARKGGVRYEAPPMEGGDDGAPQVYVHLAAQVRIAVQEHLRKLHGGRLLEECRAAAIVANTHDPYRAYRQFLFDLLREPGEENRFFAGGRPDSRTHNLPLMPLLSGDNPITNVLPSKFLRLTDLQYYLLRQWAAGLFYNEKREGWTDPSVWWPYADWVNRTGGDVDRGVLTNVAGGAFCPGAELGWVMRNPSIYWRPGRIKADPTFAYFMETAAQMNTSTGSQEAEFSSYIQDDLSQDNDFDTGLQPGDLTKYMALPWQSDFNECSTQTINVTYLEWNELYPDSDGDSRLGANERVWETLWWPAHRPMETWEVTGQQDGQPVYSWTVWARGVPQTKEGDLKMVTEWWRLGFVVRNPAASPDMRANVLPPPQPPPYISTERTPRRKETT